MEVLADYHGRVGSFALARAPIAPRLKPCPWMEWRPCRTTWAILRLGRLTKSGGRNCPALACIR
jgi:hypothetical protein